jgi:GNAT superfamily N-acetyltransferase
VSVDRATLLGSAVMAEAIRRLKATDTVLLWTNARGSAVPFYERFGFHTIERSGFVPLRRADPTI